MKPLSKEQMAVDSRLIEYQQKIQPVKISGSKFANLKPAAVTILEGKKIEKIQININSDFFTLELICSTGFGYHIKFDQFNHKGDWPVPLIKIENKNQEQQIDNQSKF